jgi:hypothetical protein
MSIMSGGLSMKIIAATFLAVTAAILSVGAQEGPKQVTLIQLIAEPQKFDGQLVTTQGFLRVQGGHHDIVSYSLYLHKEDAQNLLAESILLVPKKQMQRSIEKLEHEYVTVTGRFRVVRTARDSHVAAIRDLLECKLSPDLNDPGTEKY